MTNTAKLTEELERYEDHTGKMYKIPIITSLKEVDGELVCEIEGYSIQRKSSTTKDESNT